MFVYSFVFGLSSGQGDIFIHILCGGEQTAEDLSRDSCPVVRHATKLIPTITINLCGTFVYSIPTLAAVQRVQCIAVTAKLPASHKQKPTSAPLCWGRSQSYKKFAEYFAVGGARAGFSTHY